jgi:hypothetical protein
LRNVDVTFSPRNIQTHHNYALSGDDEIDINVDTHNGSAAQIKRTILHELQHQEQDWQGMVRGGNYAEDVANEDYYRRSREAMAFQTERRAYLTPEQRASRPPWLDYVKTPESEIEWARRPNALARPEAR